MGYLPIRAPRSDFKKCPFCAVNMMSLHMRKQAYIKQGTE